MSTGSNHIFQRIQRRSKAREIAESLIERPSAAATRRISTVGEAADAGCRFEETCLDCGAVTQRTGGELATSFGRKTPLKSAVSPCPACGSRKVSVMPK